MSVSTIDSWDHGLGVAQIQRLVRFVVAVIAVLTVAWHLFYAFLFPVAEKPHVVIHWGLLLGIFYLTELDFEADGRRDHLNNALKVVMLATTVVVSVYAFVHVDPEWLFDAKMLLEYGLTDLAVGAAAILITLHASYLAFGRALLFVGIAGIVYALFGSYFPGILNHPGIELERLLFSTTITLGDGVWGYLMEVGATWVVIFILYAGLIEGYGGMDYITQLGRRLGSRFEGGVVQVAVVTSFIVGSFMGGSVSNVATTGSFTIPMMKDRGVPPEIAGAIESMASTGGQILPPVMGSAAFIMADILGISYFEVIIGALLPALLFYLPVAFLVFLSNRKHGWGRESDAGASELASETTTDSRTGADQDTVQTDGPAEDVTGTAADRTGVLYSVAKGLPYILSFVVLVYSLMVAQYDPLYSGAYAIVAVVIFAFPRYLVIEGVSTSAVTSYVRATVDGCIYGSKNQAPLTAVLSMLGVVVTILTQSGFTQDFSHLILTSFQGIGLVLLVLVMVMSIIFGMGMPSAPAYIVVAIVSAPVLTNVGMEPLVAHLFVFYFALLSTITPPVALSCAMAAGISGASFYAVSKETLRLGLYSFIIPFVFVYWPSLIVWDGFTPVAFLIALVGICTLGFALVGYNGRRGITRVEQGIFGVCAVAVLFAPAVLGQVFVWPILAVTILWTLANVFLLSTEGLTSTGFPGV